MRDLPHDIIKRVFPLVVVLDSGQYWERLATKTFLQTIYIALLNSFIK
jgi:hypothetical protein